MQPHPDPRPADAFWPPHDEFCPRCYPAPSWLGLVATLSTVLVVAVFVVAGTVIGLNLVAWAAVGGR